VQVRFDGNRLHAFEKSEEVIENQGLAMFAPRHIDLSFRQLGQPGRLVVKGLIVSGKQAEQAHDSDYRVSRSTRASGLSSLP
jgi:hypothetical protein